MKVKLHYALILLLVLCAPFGGYLIACSLISIETPEPLRQQLDYMSIGMSTYTMLFGFVLIVIPILAIFIEPEVKVTDERLKEKIETRARELIDKAFNSVK